MPSSKASLIRKIAIEQSRIASCGDLLKGSICKVSRCRSSDGTARDSWMLTFKGHGGKTKSVYVRPEKLAAARQMIENYKKAKAALENIVDLNVELLKMD